MILVVSQKEDYHVDYLLKRINDHQKKYLVRLNTEDFPEKVKISVGFKERTMTIDDRVCNLADINCVWYRRPAKSIGRHLRSGPEKQYAIDESWYFLLSIWEEMNCGWVNKPSAIKNASYKWEQLNRARRMGFIVPESLFTNNSVDADKFRLSHSLVIAKPVHTGHLRMDDGKYKMIYASPISLDVDLSNVSASPVIFQEYIKKELELRITVVNKKVFACAIYSQTTEKTKYDWRHYDLDNTPHEVWELPKAIEKKCINLVKSYGLIYGAIDMILTPAGEYVFLEINPNGQWVWIEEMTGLPISGALIEYFYSGK